MGLSTSGLKILLICVMLTLTITFGTLPIFLFRFLDKRRQQSKSKNGKIPQWPTIVLSMLTCFSGGIFISLCFLDILNESIEAFDSLKAQNIWNIEYPLVQLICLLSFFLIYIVDEISCKIFTRTHGHGHGGHSHAHDHIHEIQPEELYNRTNSVPEPESPGNQLFIRTGSISENGNGIIAQHRQSTNSAEIASKTGSDTTLIMNGNGAKNGRKEDHNNNIPNENAKVVLPKTVEERKNIVKTMNFLLAIIFHSVFDGIALGVQDSDFSLVSLFFGLGVHKSIEAFSVGLRIIRCHPDRPWFSFILILPYAISSPIFAVLGMVITDLATNEIARNKMTTIMLSMSMGTFLYIAFFEMLGPEKEEGKNPIFKLCAAFLGFSIIAVIMIFGG